ncbi:ferritin-like domain-containing protein [Nordella sp. HKS 07]|uniref:YciE/YciF ferroxidase family protein n=1 Tax=Nordella sp. HKS 07 TaxID=2712222 RepID=UPI0013E1AFCF|nr:ferritin-like domain-containing protein [Nordella sp. HKS 07]QIG49120.1 ferritin-like domain-containing protein [Nordella sp. HKS 07]
MTLKTLDDLFEDTLRDIYYAEKKLVKTLPKMAKKASDKELAQAFTNHKMETEGQVARLEKIFEIIGKPARGKTCDAMDGLVAEGSNIMDEADNDGVMDAGLIASAQAVEHYEMARYGTLIAWADQLDLPKASSLLQETLAEEKAADKLLSDIAATANPAAQHAEAAE